MPKHVCQASIIDFLEVFLSVRPVVTGRSSSVIRPKSMHANRLNRTELQGYYKQPHLASQHHQWVPTHNSPKEYTTSASQSTQASNLPT